MPRIINLLQFCFFKLSYMLKKLSLYTLFVLATIEVACQERSRDSKVTQPAVINKTIGADEFEKKLAELKNAQLIDVRTPEEYDEGRLKGAKNIDWRASDFADQVSKLNKNAPVLVYCLGGGRSKAAAEKLEELGFTTIYDLQGGYLKWTAANKPVVGPGVPEAWQGMTNTDFTKLVTSDKYVLIDFNAKWCRPCQEMLPILEKMGADKKDKLILVKIDADANKSLMKDKAIDAIPFLELYKGGKLVWKHQGAIDEQTLLQETGL